MIVAGDLGSFDPAWSGWTLRAGKLISPEGWELTAADALAVPLLRAQLAAYQAKERQVLSMDEQPLPGQMPTVIAS